jgi:hypothetical protein
MKVSHGKADSRVFKPVANLPVRGHGVKEVAPKCSAHAVPGPLVDASRLGRGRLRKRFPRVTVGERGLAGEYFTALLACCARSLFVAIIDDHATRRRILPFQYRAITAWGGHCGDAGCSRGRLVVSCARPCHFNRKAYSYSRASDQVRSPAILACV